MIQPNRRIRVAGVLLAVALLVASRAGALINPNFTPKHLVSAAKQIMEVEITRSADGAIGVTVVKALKGEAPAKVILDLSKTDGPHKKSFIDSLSAGKQLAMIYVGDIKDGDNDAGAGDNKPAELVGRLHIGGRWFSLAAGKDGALAVVAWSTWLNGTWSSSTDMLAKVTRYILSDPDATVPSDIDANWDPKKIGKVAGKVSGAAAVDLGGAGRISLVVYSDAGDRVYQRKDKVMVDVTEQIRLASKSLAAAWGDFNGDGRLDLASWDGKVLTIHEQAADGTFVPKASRADVKECIGLAVMGDEKSPCAILVSTSTVPLLLRPQADGTFKSEEVVDTKGKAPGAALGEARTCLVADFDGDGVIDIIQPFAKGSVFYKGKAGAGFDVPSVSSALATGAGRATAGLGDYDADGLPDVLTSSEEGEASLIWQNLGGGKFAEVTGYGELPLSGEPAYKSKAKAVALITCDVNNDGRQDIFLAYSNTVPQVFFNRGFRSFALPQKVNEPPAFNVAEQGTQAAAVADFSGSGCQDIALVLKNGDVYMLTYEAGERGGLGVRAVLPLREKHAGPLPVTGWCGGRCLGVWQIAPGGEAFFGRTEPGPITLKWCFPGGKPQETKVLVEDGVVRCELGRAGAATGK